MSIRFLAACLMTCLTLTFFGCGIFSKGKNLNESNVDKTLTQTTPMIPEAKSPAQEEPRAEFEQEPAGVKNNG